MINSPWYLEEPRIEEALVPEEAAPQAAGNKPAALAEPAGGRID